LGPTTNPTTTQAAGGTGIFRPLPKVAGVTAAELEPLLATMKQLKGSGPDKLAQAGPVQLTVQQRLSAAICGLTDTPLVLDLSAAQKSVDLDSPIPQELDLRLKRLWVLLIRSKVEVSDQS
jgi:hypothetical protein